MTKNAVRIAALALLAGMLCAWPLWDESARLSHFPLLPLVEGVPFSGVPAQWQAIFLAASAALLALLPGNRWLLALTAALLLLLCLLDLNRLQPWVWLYLLIFLIALQTLNTQHLALSGLRLILAAVYFWAGFHKFTPYFAEDNFSWFCEAFALTKPLGQYPVLGYAVALLEMSFAAGLLWPRTRRWFRALVVGFHVVILVVLSPWGHDWNLVVWPWNLAMAALVWVLFAPTPREAEGSQASCSTFLKRATPREWAGLVGPLFAWLAPLLGLWGLWPHALSWQLYTNTQPEATFYVETTPRFLTKKSEAIWTANTPDSPTKLFLDDWAMRDLGVPIFASERTFRQVGRFLCNCQFAAPDSAGLYILTVYRWDKSAEQEEKIPCKDLEK